MLTFHDSPPYARVGNLAVQERNALCSKLSLKAVQFCVGEVGYFIVELHVTELYVAALVQIIHAVSYLRSAHIDLQTVFQLTYADVFCPQRIYSPKHPGVVVAEFLAVYSFHVHLYHSLLRSSIFVSSRVMVRIKSEFRTVFSLRKSMLFSIFSMDFFSSLSSDLLAYFSSALSSLSLSSSTSERLARLASLFLSSSTSEWLARLSSLSKLRLRKNVIAPMPTVSIIL
nr:MAG TPA: hypothetical protein [Caudoviricetes sp.]